MKNATIFTAAHKLASTFEGNYSACFALALRTLYAQQRQPEFIRIIVGKEVCDNQLRSFWAAEITGKCDTYGFSRKFVSEKTIDYKSSKHAYLDIDFRAFPGKVYEVCRNGQRFFATIVGGKFQSITRDQVSSFLAF